MTPRTLVLALACASTAAGCGGGEAHSGGAPASPSESTPQSEPRAEAPRVTAEADAAIQEMSDYLASLESFTVDTRGSIEVVLETGQTLGFPYQSEVHVRRPDRLRSDRIGEATALHFYYDGQTFTLYGEKAGLYAVADAPPTLDEAIEAARENLDIEAPGADLLASDVHATLMEDVVSGFVVGDAMVDGTETRHLAFRGHEVDWQIWIEKGPQPVPRRYVITSKEVEGTPEFTVELDWNTSVALADSVFEFTPPPDAHRIDFLPLRKEKTS